MTTGESGGIPAQQSAPEIPAQRSAADEQGADKQETAPLTGRVVTPADDLRQLEAEIERTREQLGQTVQELAARVDVKSRARAKAAELSDRAKSTALEARRNAAARAGSVRSQVTSRTEAARQKAISAGAGGRDQLRNRAAAVGTPVWEATPEQVRRAVTKGANSTRERWLPLTLAAGALIVGYLAVRQWNRRSPATGRMNGLDPSRQYAQRAVDPEDI